MYNPLNTVPEIQTRKQDDLVEVAKLTPLPLSNTGSVEPTPGSPASSTPSRPRTARSPGGSTGSNVSELGETDRPSSTRQRRHSGHHSESRSNSQQSQRLELRDQGITSARSPLMHRSPGMDARTTGLESLGTQPFRLLSPEGRTRQRNYSSGIPSKNEQSIQATQPTRPWSTTFVDKQEIPATEQWSRPSENGSRRSHLGQDDADSGSSSHRTEQPSRTVKPEHRRSRLVAEEAKDPTHDRSAG
ncbi:hypothetical protein CROQUDRAFT_99778 [Cronartium quercuum f. sp. fusiforme G11]|uniref:Uncharacterized protein n=1 Tax=Cronartium quercuum f. sp. fusiforme G11 TaxID=708437 RepID=A0A9P6N6P8_9BASI|nr:hypothetical protein CROQUDRAFT_99778 [Cronartium quercuum f. sp. fusiforme G11]